jgi:putative ATP-binding cassette transporter
MVRLRIPLRRAKPEERSPLKFALRLAKIYLMSEERRFAWLALFAVIACNLGNVYIDVRINQWNNAFYNALQDFDAPAFFWQLGIFCLLAAASMVLSVYAIYLNQMLQLRWRRWLTERYIGRWLAERTYFRMQLDREATDNPDQRISEDLNQFTTYALTLSLGLLSSVVSVVSFLFILWGLSGPADIDIFGWTTVHIPAYLVWAALLYAGAGTFLTIKIGRRLIPLTFSQQRFEADFRFSLMRVRENAENIALYGGERPEREVFRDRFARVYDNFWKIMKRRKAVNWFTSGYNQLAVVFPVLVVAPRYFSKQIQLGGLMQVIDAFVSVQASLSFIVTSYTDIATWAAVTQRLSSFDQRMRDIGLTLEGQQTVESRRAGQGLEISSLDVDRPDGSRLLEDIRLNVAPSEAVLLTGSSGLGKSTLLRVLAGIWPYGGGGFRIGAGRAFFLPQRPYIPLGTLATALAYPEVAEPALRPRIVKSLEQVGLGAFTAWLDESEDWPHRLSLGEQQRLAFARVLLAEPEIVFLDEATSALDENVQTELYSLLRNAPWHPTIISIGHRQSLAKLHDRVLDLTQFRAREATDTPPPVAAPS